jgi:general secretion pathway protein A
MYRAFYGLEARPFDATPDPRFLTLTAGHREALAQLVYGVRESRGFIVLTGEVGTGKTTLLQALMQRLRADTAFAYVFNSTLPFDALLEYALEDLGVPGPGRSRAHRLAALYRFLTERRRAGSNTVLIVDEAQHLDPATLEQIRLLSNFESPTEKLLQIVLAGQPELLAVLDRADLRQLRQRIAIRATIPPLTAAETRELVRTRLAIAGAQDAGLFTDRAIARIGSWSRGIPRVVNMVAEHCLVVGYADQIRRIDVDIVERSIAYFHGPSTWGPRMAPKSPLGSPRQSRDAPRPGAVVAVAAVVLAVVAISSVVAVGGVPAAVGSVGAAVDALSHLAATALGGFAR